MEEKEKKEEELGLYLNCKTRIGDINVFYDFSSDKVNEINLFLEKNYYIVESKEIECFELYNNIPKNTKKYLFKIVVKHNSKGKKIESKINYNTKPEYEIDKSNIINWEQCLWYIINSDSTPKELTKMENKDYILKENDVLKIGYYKYIISKIYFKNKDYPKKGIFSTIPTYKDIMKCEHCDEYMVRLCKCEDYIHIKELKKKVKDSTIIRENAKTTSFYFNIIQCEEDECKDGKKCTFYLLKYKYKDEDIEKIDEINKNNNNIEKKDNILSFFDFDEYIPKDSDYMIIESIDEAINDQNLNKIVKFVYIIKLDGKDITIGKDNSNDIILNDKLASKKHAVIKYDNGNLIIKNMSEHSGTLALLRPKDKKDIAFIIPPEETFFFQSNKTIFESKIMSKEVFLKYYKNEKSKYPIVTSK